VPDVLTAQMDEARVARARESRLPRRPAIGCGAGLFVGLPIVAVIALITLITLVGSCYGMCEKMRTFGAHGVDRT
jgi:hypothetical protein